jgi:hypothetical protein
MLILLLASFAHAASEVGGSRDFGIGLSFGSHVEGISLKLHDSTVAYQIVIGGYGGFDNFGERWGARIDWLAETPSFVETDALDLAVNVGIGGFGGYLNPGFEGGVEGVLGIEALLVPIPVDVVFEWTPMFLLTNPPWHTTGPGDQRFHPAAFAGHVRVWF